MRVISIVLPPSERESVEKGRCDGGPTGPFAPPVFQTRDRAVSVWRDLSQAACAAMAERQVRCESPSCGACEAIARTQIGSVETAVRSLGEALYWAASISIEAATAGAAAAAGSSASS